MRTFLFALFLLPQLANAQDSLATRTLDEVVVTGTKYEVSRSQSGKTIHTITREQLDRNAGKSLSDVLNDVPGIQIDGNFGAPGSNISYYVRGGRNKNTLVLIDGVPLSDPSSINSEYDLRYVPLLQVGSVEVLKGGWSTLYGSGAAAGVIDIRLKEPENGKVISGMLDINGGSYGTFGQTLQVSGGAGKLSWLLFGDNLSSEGFSHALDEDPAVEFDKDGFNRQNVLAKATYQFSKRFKLGVHSAYEQFVSEYDAFEFSDTPNEQDFHQLRNGVTPEYVYSRGEIGGKFFLNVNRREFKDEFYPVTYDGRNFQAEATHRHRFSEMFQVLYGVNYQRLAFGEEEFQARDTTTFSIIDPFASAQLDLPHGLGIHSGFRINNHSEYGTKFLYHANPFWLISSQQLEVKLFGSVSSSFIAPTLYQLYSFYGNPDLHPEQATNYEAGVDLNRKKKFGITATWFHRNETDPIDFFSIIDGENFSGEYRNFTDSRRVYGIELNGKVGIWKDIDITGHYTFSDTDRPETFYRIPKVKWGVTVAGTAFRALSFSAKFNHTGARKTYYFITDSAIGMRAYQLVDLFASWEFSKVIRVYGAVNNIFDEEFVAVYGYTTRGRNFSAGLQLRFSK